MSSADDLLANGSTPMGVVFPPRPRAPLPDKDAREHALETLREYISRLVFRRTMEPGMPARGFKIPRERIHVYQPDDLVSITPPALAFIPGIGGHEATEAFALGAPREQESSIDRFGAGTVLMSPGEYVETFDIEIVSTKHAVRRAIVAGLTVALRPSDSSGALRLRLANYYDETATFTLLTTTYVDDADVVKNRRRARLNVELRVPEVAPVNYVPLTVIADMGGPDALGVLDGNVVADLDGTVIKATDVRRGGCFRDP